VAEDAAGRDASFYVGPGGWVAASVDYLDSTRLLPAKQALPHDRLWKANWHNQLAYSPENRPRRRMAGNPNVGIQPELRIESESGRQDLNLRPLDPQSSALARLRHAPLCHRRSDGGGVGQYRRS
jgi:hypothetical protein